jgi:hypothetical protein
MPHWEGIIDTASPAILHRANGDPHNVRETLMAEAPAGANVRSISWLAGEDRARIVVEGPAAEDYLTTLEAQDVRRLVTSGERVRERDSTSTESQGSEPAEEDGSE